jgi:WD40 repeat protein
MNSRCFLRPILCSVFAFSLLSGHSSCAAEEGERSAAYRPRLVDSTADGRFYAYGTDQGRIVFGKTSPNAPARTFYLCETHAIALSPDGRFLAAAGKIAGSPTLIKVWDTKEGTVLSTLPAQVNSRTLLKFSPDGESLASTSQGGLEVWKVLTGERLSRHRADSFIAHLKFRTEKTHALIIVCDDGKSRTIALR